MLIVWSLPSLTILSKRELVKRANAIAIKEDSAEIVVADKFGDIYT
jgi:hypothetical protein